MLKRITAQALTELIENNQLCLSFYLPTYKKGPEVQQNKIRLKNLLADAEHELKERGLRPREIESLLKPVASLLPDQNFWNNQDEGLAIFRTQEGFETYGLPYNVDEHLSINNKFYVRPLFPAVNQNREFYILALSQNEVRLLEANRDKVKVMELDAVPQSLAEVLKSHDLEKQLQLHTQPQRSSKAAIFHGHGVGDGRHKKDEVRRYFHLVSDGITEILREKEAPLLLAAVDYLHPIYHKANDYPHIFAEGIVGSPEDLSPEELHERAWSLVSPYFTRKKTEAIEFFNELSETKKTCTDTATIVKAAHFGRIHTLFVNSKARQYGVVIPDDNDVSLEECKNRHNEELINKAAADTYANGGLVYVLGKEAMPEGASIAAILRYTI